MAEINEVVAKIILETRKKRRSVSNCNFAETPSLENQKDKLYYRPMR